MNRFNIDIRSHLYEFIAGTQLVQWHCRLLFASLFWVGEYLEAKVKQMFTVEDKF